MWNIKGFCTRHTILIEEVFFYFKHSKGYAPNGAISQMAILLLPLQKNDNVSSLGKKKSSMLGKPDHSKLNYLPKKSLFQ